MKKKAIIIWLSAAWIVMLLLVIGGATYAWFTFNPYTNVEPISSTISDGEVALLISADPTAEFQTECLLPKTLSEEMKPVTTADLEHFYTFAMQNRQGITIEYRDAMEEVDADTIHGVFYLQSLKDDCNVYFYRNGCSFGEDPQMLAALRLGMKITIGEQIKTYIFALNAMGNTEGAQTMQTTEREKVVVQTIGEGGAPAYVADPARELTTFFAVPPADNKDVPKAGREALCTIQAGEIAMVEYWLYLEGCDDNCVNEVQNREVSMQLSFAGVTAK